MDAPDKTYTHDIWANWRVTAPVMMRALRDMNQEDRDLLTRKLFELVRQLAPGGE